jgi:serine/threonine protein kinase
MPLKILCDGGSGDLLYVIKNLNHDYRVIKISSSSHLLEEYQYIELISKLYVNQINPIVKIYEKGKLRLDKKFYYYYIMENLDEPKYIILDKFIQNHYKISELSVLQKKMVYTIFKNIIHAVSIFKKAGYSHCDLHTQNIFIDTETFDIKIIDFGLAKEGSCEQGRKTTSKIIDTYIKCRKSTEFHKLMLLWNSDYIDSDLAMIGTILCIFFDKCHEEFQILEYISKMINTQLNNRAEHILDKMFINYIYIIDSIFKKNKFI